MNTQKHTDGPWHITKEEKFLTIGTFITVRDSRDGVIAGTHVNDESNARLIAAAPDLLAALKGLMQRAVKDAEKYAQNGNEPIWAYISDASDAIAKAEGVK